MFRMDVLFTEGLEHLRFIIKIFSSTGSPAAAVLKNAGMASAIGAAAVAAKDIRSSAGAAAEAAAATS